MNLKYEVILRKPAAKFIAKQDQVIQKRIIQALEGLEYAPPKGDVKPLKGVQGQYRLRIGSFRALYEVNENECKVYVFLIGNRGDIYS